MAAGPLGRTPSKDDVHVKKFPLTLETAPAKPTPMVIGVNWYTAFDRPEKDVQGHWWIGRSGDLGPVRGGHCVALKHKGAADLMSWYDFYNQGTEGACVGFGASRVMTLMNRHRYFARWLWDRAKEIDEWPETAPGDNDGTSVRASLDVLRDKGHVNWSSKYSKWNRDGEGGDSYPRSGITPQHAQGIAANRWATSASDVLEVVGYTAYNYVDILNSWGRSYPHLVRMPIEVVDRLLREDGEFGVVTDR